ncbi:hypothetical protein AAG570_011670 [Ranatra chinensis]|uniref:Kinesin motor domain-containing protein n=1 Tax=Ranatra chinensis TaxID=642074 RepID=A0ABD0YT11_9HEMI
MLNKFSSRSHSIFTIKLVKRRLSDNKIEITSCSFTLCDLAGVERHKKMENVAQHLRETQNINTSHLVLNRCFRIIRENQKSGEKSHVPFRDSKLTQILQRALTGTDKMAMIVNISQCLKLVQETQHVLRTSAEAHKIESVYKPPQRRKSRFLTAYNECRSK